MGALGPDAAPSATTLGSFAAMGPALWATSTSASASSDR
jgi:hypothetical protein